MRYSSSTLPNVHSCRITGFDVLSLQKLCSCKYHMTAVVIFFTARKTRPANENRPTAWLTSFFSCQRMKRVNQNRFNSLLQVYNTFGTVNSPLRYSCQRPKKSASGLKGGGFLSLVASVFFRVYHITTCSPFRVAEEVGRFCKL